MNEVEVQEVSGIPNARMVLIPPGEFLMGSPNSDKEAWPDEKPQTQVTLTRGFWMWQTPVTQAQFEVVMGYNPSYFTGDGERPVEQVSWHEAAAFCDALSRLHGLPECFDCRGEGVDVVCSQKATTGADYYGSAGWRLPTEAEWEYACRAGNQQSRYGALDAIAWCGTDAGGQTYPVAQKQPNAWGLYDILGNVWEWCCDGWTDNLPGGSVTDPVVVPASDGSERVLRGGSWFDLAWWVRAASRFGWSPGYCGGSLGFRLMRSDIR